MNHPTEHVEELILLSQQAIACDDYEQAGLFLRRAIELAPLRKDLRAELARVLTHSSADRDFSPESAGQTVPAPEQWSPRSRTATRSSQRLQPLPSTALATVMRGPIGSASVAATSRPAPSSTQVSVRTEGNVNVRVDEEPLSFSDFDDDMGYADGGRRTALHTLLEDDDESEIPEPLPAPAPARRRRSKSRLIQQRATLEDWIANGFERSVRSIKHANPVRAAYICCYFALAVFVGAACFQSRRVFGDQQKKFSTVKAKPATVTAVEQASVDVPSLLSSTGPTLPLKTEEDVLDEGRGHLNKRNFEKAIQCLEPALSANTRTASYELIRETLSKAYDGEATRQLQQNSFSDAVQLYRKALKLAPLSTGFQVHLSNALFYQATSAKSPNKKLLQEAAQLASNVVLVEPQNSNAHTALAQAQGALGKNKEARTAWQRVSALTAKGSPSNKRAAEFLQQNKGA